MAKASHCEAIFEYVFISTLINIDVTTISIKGKQSMPTLKQLQKTVDELNQLKIKKVNDASISDLTKKSYMRFKDWRLNKVNKTDESCTGIPYKELAERINAAHLKTIREIVREELSRMNQVSK